MSLSETPPTNLCAFYSCGFCSTHAQVLVEAYDGEGNRLLNWEGVPQMKNDDETAAAEMRKHMAEAHPEIDNG